MSKFSNLNEECWFREYSVDFIFCCLILSCLNSYAIAQPMWRIGIAPNGMALVAIGSFFTIINCSQSTCQKWIIESCSSSLICRSKIWRVKLNEHSLFYYSLIIILSAPPFASPHLSLLARSRHAGCFRDRSPCSNLKAACGIEATIFKLQFYPDGGHILEENKNKMSIYNIFLFFSNCYISNLKSAPPVLSLYLCDGWQEAVDTDGPGKWVMSSEYSHGPTKL